MTAGALTWLLGRNAFWAAVATLGFAVSFSVPKYALLAGMLIGVLASACARWFAGSAVLFAASPAIPLVPGTYAYKAVVGLLLVAGAPSRERSTDVLMAAFDDGIKALLTIMALSCGIALPGLVSMSSRSVPERAAP